MLYQSSGILKYNDPSEKVGYRLVVEIDPGITDYYRALIPPWFPKLNRQLYPPHISVVRREVPPLPELWGLHEGEEVEFTYDNVIQNGKVYWWLNCFSARLEEIRLELGLPVDSPYTRPPEGYLKCFHSSLGNTKNHPVNKN